MFDRASAEAVDSAQIHRIMFGDDAPHSLVEFFANAKRPD